MSIDFSVINALLPIASDCGQQETDKSHKFTKVSWYLLQQVQQKGGTPTWKVIKINLMFMKFGIVFVAPPFVVLMLMHTFGSAS